MNAVVSITKKKQNFPTGTVAAAFRFFVSGPSGNFSQDEPLSSSQSTFSNLLPGIYTVSVSLLSSLGTTLGTPVTGTFTVPDAGVDLDVPDTVTVALA